MTLSSDALRSVETRALPRLLCCPVELLNGVRKGSVLEGDISRCMAHEGGTKGIEEESWLTVEGGTRGLRNGRFGCRTLAGVTGSYRGVRRLGERPCGYGARIDGGGGISASRMDLVC